MDSGTRIQNPNATSSSTMLLFGVLLSLTFVAGLVAGSYANILGILGIKGGEPANLETSQKQEPKGSYATQASNVIDKYSNEWGSVLNDVNIDLIAEGEIVALEDGLAQTEGQVITQGKDIILRNGNNQITVFVQDKAEVIEGAYRDATTWDYIEIQDLKLGDKIYIKVNYQLSMPNPDKLWGWWVLKQI